MYNTCMPVASEEGILSSAIKVINGNVGAGIRNETLCKNNNKCFSLLAISLFFSNLILFAK